MQSIRITQLKMRPSDSLDRRRQYRQRCNRKNPHRIRLDGCRQRAKKKGLEFNITVEDIVVPEFCPVLGIPLITTPGRRTDNSPSIDRVDNKLGYIKGNVRVISTRANDLKKDADLDEIVALAVYVATHMRDKKKSSKVE